MMLGVWAWGQCLVFVLGALSRDTLENQRWLRQNDGVISG